MTVATFIDRMRGRQADLFSETVIITADGTGPGTLDPETARRTPPAPVEVYDGPGLVRPEGDSTADVGESSSELDAFVVKVPPNTPVLLGHVVTITASTYDEGLVERTMRVVHVWHDGWQIARKVRAVDETPRPA